MFRLPSSDVPVVRQKGKRAVTDLLELRYLPHPAGTPRFAVVVPARVDKRAVYRNRMKRLVHESLRLLLPTLPAVNAIIFVRKYADITQPQMQANVAALFERAFSSKA